ncbi:isomerase [Rhodococcus sp. SRB_17]|uniref:nuclear transport factor 2 family protein n=1 Tax=Acidovorax sp. SRB_24 TaxID=1962700 RepID=UPI00145EF857|nr:nuclear transport factor 2 family protein [Acidovorax sp. SRB_24]NMM76593.1 isomerase [Acidovorax sp. SRB_24]NMM89851.1 isomerase [Rhodococcus sp. SRB_17]
MPSTPTTSADAADAAASVAAIAAFFETLTPDTIGAMDRVYAADARFKDPFNEVQGLAAIMRIYAHMFETLHGPRFVVTGRVLQGRECFLTWNFCFRFKGIQPATAQTVRGCSHLVLDAHGRIAVHRDYWDAAEELYEKIPVLGGLMRWLRKRASS